MGAYNISCQGSLKNNFKMNTMKNIRWAMQEFWIENSQKKYLIRDTITVNVITCIGAKVVDPVRSQVAGLTGKPSWITIKY